MPRRPQPKLLIVAPMSGHYPTLLRGTVETFLPNHDVYITEWADARMVPLTEGRFDLDDYIDYIISMLHVLGGDVHVIAVCQPSVPVMAAVSLMEADKDPYVPHSMVLMGGPIDTRINSNAVNKLAENRGLDWFRSHVITKVPFPHPGFMRDVYPGFLQLHGFMSMNLDRHHRGAPQSVHCIWSRATAIRRRSTANSTTNISRSWISPPSSICRRSTPCSSATRCRRAR